MLTKGEWLLIRDLHSRAFNISVIARVMGHDRKTVRKYLNLETAPEPQKHPIRSSKLDPYKPYILESSMKKAPIPLLDFFMKFRKWALTEK